MACEHVQPDQARELIHNGKINLLLGASTDRTQGAELYRSLRQQAIASKICYTTNSAASQALLQALAYQNQHQRAQVQPL